MATGVRLGRQPRQPFVAEVRRNPEFLVAAVAVDLYGSLALTGKGHATDTAVIMGLCGEEPASADTEGTPALLVRVARTRRVSLLARHAVQFDPDRDLVFHMKQRQPFHSNALAFTARDAGGDILARRMYYSVGGGFVVDEDEACGGSSASEDDAVLPYDFNSAADPTLMREGNDTSAVYVVMPMRV